MKQISLQQALNKYTQTVIAQALGLTQGAIPQMVKAGRDIYIRESKDGICCAFEIKPVGKICPVHQKTQN